MRTTIVCDAQGTFSCRGVGTARDLTQTSHRLGPYNTLDPGRISGGGRGLSVFGHGGVNVLLLSGNGVEDLLHCEMGRVYYARAMLVYYGRVSGRSRCLEGMCLTLWLLGANSGYLFQVVSRRSAPSLTPTSARVYLQGRVSDRDLQRLWVVDSEGLGFSRPAVDSRRSAGCGRYQPTNGGWSSVCWPWSLLKSAGWLLGWPPGRGLVV